MTAKMLRALLCGAAMRLMGSAAAQAQQYYPAWYHPWRQTTAPLFSNYYVYPPATCGGVPAALYVSPLPVPPHVGHTYVTNQVFMPHEMLYKHHRKYYAWHNRGGNYTTTSVTWW